MPRLALDDHPQPLPLPLVPLRRLQPRQHLLRDRPPALFYQQTLVVQLQLHPLVHHAHHRAVDDDLPELFDLVKHQAGLPRPVGVDEPAVRVQPRQDQRPLHLAVQDAVAIVERRVDRVPRAASPPPGPPVLLRDDLLERAPVLFRRPPLGRQDLPPGLVHTVPLHVAQLLQVIPHLVRAPAQLLVQLRVGLLAVLGDVAQEPGLVGDLAPCERQRQLQPPPVSVCQQLLAPRQHRPGQPRRVQRRVRPPPAVDEIDRDPGRAASPDRVRRQADPLPRHQDLLQVQERRFGQLLPVLRHPQAPAVLADERAVLVYDQMMDDGHMATPRSL